MEAQGRRMVGRPKRRWMDCVGDNLREKQLSEDDVYDRAAWRRCQEYRPHMNGKRCIDKEEEDAARVAITLRY